MYDFINDKLTQKEIDRLISELLDSTENNQRAELIYTLKK